jgi:CBS domain containing-hemolysin-like protein
MLTTILLIVGISLFGSFLCSLFEAALYSIPPTRVEAMRRAGKLGAKKLAGLRARIDQPIAAILTFNTITHTMGATWAGALVGETYGNYWVTWFSVAFTIAILFLTEIIPKTIGVVHAGTLGSLSAWPIQAMIWLVWPLAWISVKVTERLTKRAEAAGPSEEEILVMADLAHKSGKVLPEEHSWIQKRAAAGRRDGAPSADAAAGSGVAVRVADAGGIAWTHAGAQPHSAGGRRRPGADAAWCTAGTSTTGWCAAKPTLSSAR